MRISERLLSIPRADDRDLIAYLRRAVANHLPRNTIPTRLVITKMDMDRCECELGFIENIEPDHKVEDIFRFVRRRSENTQGFTAVLVVPTGVGAHIGGHAGDAGPVARLLASACDRLVTHPNVVNGSDINELPDNALYVEGSVLTRLLMGSAALQPVRSNRVIVLIDDHRSTLLANASVNAVNAACATYGFICPKIIRLDPPLTMRAEFNASGRSSGQILGLERLLEVLMSERNTYDAVAISSVIKVPANFHQDYFDLAGEMVNPWGGVEALLTHAISSVLDVQSAHSPMFESEEIANVDPGIVEPRMAPEAISLTFLQCILKGLQRAPRVIRTGADSSYPGLISATDLSCLIIPDGCIGLPTLAALEQGIPVIAVRENANLMQNDLQDLPWSPGQLHLVENYWEAVGVMTALKAGIAPRSVRRPIVLVPTEVRRNASSKLDQLIAGSHSPLDSA
ncbi:MAG: hypothetical protein QOG66_733 [Methylobacteriaceae bacterium]|jgi:hypothetical protein|nr:hypothetical protein [Methylobacteriaceae bacterium]